MDKENLHIFRGELALALAVIINSFGVVLMLYSGAGISAISSVPYAFSEVIPKVSLGTWTYIFQGFLEKSLFRNICSALWWALYSVNCLMYIKCG